MYLSVEINFYKQLSWEGDEKEKYNNKDEIIYDSKLSTLEYQISILGYYIFIFYAHNRYL